MSMIAAASAPRLLHALLAGAAGTTALNVVTYADMAVRGRPASSVPEQDVELLAERASVSFGAGETADNRRGAVATLLGYVTGMLGGVGWAVAEPTTRRLPQPVAAAALGAAVMAATEASSTMLGTTDPARWSPGDWVADVIPHLAYGAATVAAYAAMRDS
jgi:hypothetical protein